MNPVKKSIKIINLLNKIKSKDMKIGIIGMGYVGLPLAVEFAKNGFKVIGIDIDKDKINKLNQRKSYILDIEDDVLLNLIENKKLIATSEYGILKELNVVIICVPTPLSKTKTPNISYIIAAVKEIKKYLQKNQIIILESTTYPGTTKEIILPELESIGFKVGKDFFLAFSPERIDPGNKKYTIKNTPKVIGGITPICTELSKTLYKQIIDNVVPVSSAETAEITKLLENTFRAVNIALANEIAIMANKLDVNVWEVIDAASTKPYGFMSFYPGPGIGGHCIPIDPLYLSWKLKTLNYNAKFIELASSINSYMPNYVIEKIINILNIYKKSVNDSKILILGVAYKKDINDYRESPALEIMEKLNNLGAQIYYNDAYIPEFYFKDKKIHSTKLNKEILEKMDCVVIITDHSYYDYKWIVENASVTLDTRNATKHIKNRNKIIRL
ncbi:MAG: nucleotide sugar dehydrogenase [Promethearchaeota archaeon]